ncbi:BTB/POZ domain-containing protein At3g05675-like [Malus sylvestris]|uniref:BTB/POZ domain-containing protein At3g05675-like n=1 Tax=Malus sylvestris TaxID=3752 RepID=UPI0021ACA10C|nr:BTB/POZ domain-containing protein At3g05675-like [Malus sylvestris]
MKNLDARSQFSNHPNPDMVTGTGSKKRHRAVHPASSATASSSSRPCVAVIIDSHARRPTHPDPKPIPSSTLKPNPTTPYSFDDPSSADVILRLFVDPSPLDPSATSLSLSPATTQPQDDVVLHLHAHALRRCKYFAALLSDRWQHPHAQDDAVRHISLRVPPTPGSMDARISLLQLLYTPDLASAITTVSTALDLLPVASELIFEDCVRFCLRFLEAVPWTQDDEARVLALIPHLSEDEAKDLIARVSGSPDSSEEMLYGLILALTHNPSMAFVKAFVAKLLREFGSRDLVERVLDRAFQTTFKVVKESMEEYTSPGVRGDHDETEAIQRLNLHTAMTNGKHLVWLVERMIELRVADSAVREWSEQPAFAADLQRAFRDDAWRNIVPGLPSILLRCTSRLANAVAAGTILVDAQVRKKLVKDWLPVLIVCKDTNTSPLTSSNKPLYLDLEEIFLRIISTLPMSDSQELLQQCLSFSTRNVEDCPHLVTAFNTWFRRSTHPPQLQNLC